MRPHVLSASLVALALLSSSRHAHAEEQVYVHLRMERTVALERLDPVTRRYETVCFAPCDRDVPTGMYRICGPSIVRSRAFAIHAGGSEPVWLEVDRPNKLARGAGIALMSIGGLTLGVSAIVAAFVGPIESIGAEMSGGGTPVTNVALTGMGVGAATLVLGLVLFLPNASSKVRRVEPRAPTWTKPVVPEGAPSSFAVPIAVVAF